MCHVVSSLLSIYYLLSIILKHFCAALEGSLLISLKLNGTGFVAIASSSLKIHLF